MTKTRESVDRVKEMSKNSPTHFLRNASRVVKYGFIGYGRNIWLSLTSTIVMTLTLVLLFVTIVASIILSSTAQAMREKIDITIFIQPETSEKVLSSMVKTISTDQNVKSARYVTSAEEYDKLISEQSNVISNDVVIDMFSNDDTFRKNGLKRTPATLRIKVHDPDSIDNIKNIVAHDPEFVEYVDTSRSPTYDSKSSAIDTIMNWSNIARVGGLGLSALFLLISILVIFNTIRMAIYSRSEEIYMERLVGADKSFIRGPFLVEAMISGVVAGVIGAGVSIVAVNAIAPKLESYDIDISMVSTYINSIHMIEIFVAFIGVGVLIALVSSRFAVHKYLKKM